jgi:hypothetical protein
VKFEMQATKHMIGQSAHNSHPGYKMTQNSSEESLISLEGPPPAHMTP